MNDVNEFGNTENEMNGWKWGNENKMDKVSLGGGMLITIRNSLITNQFFGHPPARTASSINVMTLKIQPYTSYIF
jgi:hypothetical protein